MSPLFFSTLFLSSRIIVKYEICLFIDLILVHYKWKKEMKTTED